MENDMTKIAAPSLTLEPELDTKPETDITPPGCPGGAEGPRARAFGGGAAAGE